MMRASNHVQAQAVVELAITLPILLLLMLGLINLGLLVHAQITLTHASWEGARVGATLRQISGEGDPEIIGAVHRSLAGLNIGAVQISIIPDELARDQMSWPGPRGEPLTVKLTYPMQVHLPIPITVPLQAAATSRIEYQNPP